jgi:ornithine cyclodeaminase
MHVKGAYIHGASTFAFKAASGFQGNAARGLPFAGGLNLAFDAETGFLQTLLFDNGYLTGIRTGAAGALAADLLSPSHPVQVGIVGSGGQARFQLEALLGVRRPERVVVYGIEAVAEFANEMRQRLGIEIKAVDNAEEAVRGSQVVVTATWSRSPIVKAEWVDTGTHVTAVGADLPEKQEHDVGVLKKADKIVADSLEQCLHSGEIHHAVEQGVITASDVYGELGEIAAGLKRGRETAEEITFADLTGLGIQDAAIAELAVAKGKEADLGSVLEV